MPLSEDFQVVLDAAKQGADWAWSALYRELAGPVMGYLRSRGAPEPEDLTGEVLLQVARGVQGFDGDEGSFRSWVFVIAHRRLLDTRRSMARRPDFAQLQSEHASATEGGDVENEAMERLVTAELHQTFERLTEAQRDVLALRIIAGLTLEETAQVMGKRIGAVKALQRRALTALKAQIDRGE